MRIHLFMDYPPSLFLPICSFTLLIPAFYQVRAFLKRGQNPLQHLIALFICITRVCSVFTLSYYPDQIYSLWFTVLTYSIQSLLILVFFTPMDQSHIMKLPSIQRDVHALIANIKVDGSIFGIVFWNIALSTMLNLSRSFDIEALDACSLILLVVFYWLSAGKLSAMSSRLEKSPRAQVKLDLAVMCFIMVGLLNIVATAVGAFTPLYLPAVVGSLYIFEIGAVVVASDVNVPDDIKLVSIGETRERVENSA